MNPTLGLRLGCGIVGLLLGAALCVPAPVLAQVAGAEYAGTVDGGGTVKLSLSTDGTQIRDFRAFDVPGLNGADACRIGLAGAYLLSVPITGNAFSRTDPKGELSFDGSFPALQQAKGTLRISYQGCVTGSKSWTASTTAAAPGAPPPAPSGSVSGSIGDVHGVSGGEAVATYTTNFSLCTASGYCGWYPHAWQLPASRPCAVDKSHLTYVGNTHSASGTETATDTFRPAFTGKIRLCLYAYQSGAEHLVAETVFTPTGTPTSTTSPSRSFSLVRAQGAVRQALTRRFGSRFTGGSGYRRSCRRRSAVRLRCAVSWRYALERYRGTVTVWVHSAASTHTHFSISIVRRRPA